MVSNITVSKLLSVLVVVLIRYCSISVKMLRVLPCLISSQSMVLVLSLLSVAYYHYDHFINGIPSIKVKGFFSPFLGAEKDMSFIPALMCHI